MSFSIALDSRLQKVAEFVPKGAVLGDIGTDHAYLPIALYESRKIAKAVAIDVHDGPYRSALATVQQCGLEAVIDVRLGNGLTPLRPGEVDVLVLAGMGGRTMLDILAARPDVLAFVHDLVLQPQNTEGSLRRTLLDEGWRLKAEVLVEEDGRIYVVMAYSQDEGLNKMCLESLENKWLERLSFLVVEGSVAASEFQGLVCKLVRFFGPLILEKPTDLLSKHMEKYSERLKRRQEQMKRSSKLEILAKLKAIDGELAIVEGMRKWR